MELFPLFVFVTLATGSVPLVLFFNKRPRFEKPIVRSVMNVAITTPPGRIVEVYNLDLVEKYYGPWLAGEIPNISSFDEEREAFIPTNSDGMNQTTFYGIFQLGNPRAISRQSVVYKLKHRSDILIKYQANCVELEIQAEYYEKYYIHPTVVEFAYTRKASRFGIAPDVYFLSPPAALCRTMKDKCEFDMSVESFNGCKADPNSSLRYMIMDRVRGLTLAEYQATKPDGIVPFAQAMLIGEKLMSMIELLHNNASVVHGDIHLGNIMLESENPLSLKFIDFARSFENVKRPNERIRNPGWSAHPILSQWELDGYMSAPRDDVARIVGLVALIMNPPESYKVLETLSRLGRFITWKTEKDMFVIPNGLPGHRGNDPVMNLNVDYATKEQIRSILSNILRLVRRMDDVNAVPLYASIRESFRQCYELVSPTV
jgi:hypothetical protein